MLSFFFNFVIDIENINDMRLTFSLFVVIILMVFFNSCLVREEYPVEPHIEYVNFMKYTNALGIEDKAKLVFSFTDGDGDIGLAQGDTFPPFHKDGDYYYNLYIFYKEMQNGVLTHVQSPLPFHLRLPVITPSGTNKAIKGEMEIDLDIYNPISPFDTICFEFYIVDRALNKSNTVTTPLFKVQK